MYDPHSPLVHNAEIQVWNGCNSGAELHHEDIITTMLHLEMQ